MASIWGLVSIRVSTSAHSGSQSPLPLMVTCEATPRMRLRSSRSNPFMTDSTVISAHTPKVMPSMDVSVMKDMK